MPIQKKAGKLSYAPRILFTKLSDTVYMNSLLKENLKTPKKKI